MIRKFCISTFVFFLLCFCPLLVIGAGVYTDPNGYFYIFAPTSAEGLPATLLSPTSGAYKGQKAIGMTFSISNNTANCCWYKGCVPTALAGTNVGFPFYVNNYYQIVGYENITNFKCIDRVAGSASNVSVQMAYSTGPIGGTSGTTISRYYLLLEDGSKLLLETGDKFFLED
jgi:hypothetical protein